MRKILIFSLAYYPRFVGGAEVAVKEITDRMPSRELEFHMITLGDGRKMGDHRDESESSKNDDDASFEKIGNIRIHRVFQNTGVFQKIFYPFVAAKKALELHRSEKFDVIWSIMASYAGYAGYLFKKKNSRSEVPIPLFLTIQEGDHFGRRTLLKPLFKRIFKSADRIQVISNFLAEWSRSMGAKCPIDLVPNAVDIDLFSRAISDIATNALKEKLGKNENDVFLITTSRLVAKNAVGDIVESLRYLPDNVKLLVLGNGRDEIKLKVQSSKMGLHGRISFLGYVPHSEMPKYLQVSDIFVRPSLTEGLGNSFLEAMAAGIPVIGTPVGGIPDFLKDGETGLFCEVNNPKSIAQKVGKLIRDRESRDYIVRQAKEMVVKHYQWEDVTKKMTEIFSDIRYR